MEATVLSSSNELPYFASRGARAMVLMHERELREFLETWRRAHAAGLRLPSTDDANYASLEHLLHHVLRAARGYLVWCCQVLELPDPGIEATPGPEAVVDEANEHAAHVLARWRVSALGTVEEARLDEVHTSRWDVPYSIDAMLEHAVMHPRRHAFQLRELLEARP